MPKENIIEQPKPRLKMTVYDQMVRAGIQTALYENRNAGPVGVRLDSLEKPDLMGRKCGRAWIWISPGDQGRLPVCDVYPSHRLTRIENVKGD